MIFCKIVFFLVRVKSPHVVQPYDKIYLNQYKSIKKHTIFVLRLLIHMIYRVFQFLGAKLSVYAMSLNKKKSVVQIYVV